jgi:FkbM family methyltransferase
MWVSYAQNGEDVILGRTFWDVPHGFYVDIGAWHPETESVTKVFYDRGWSGVNVEPQPACLAAFAEARPRDINVGLAVSDTPGAIQLHVPRFTALATVNTGVIDSANPDYATEGLIEVQCVTLAQLLDTYAPGRVIHFLKIDVEGHEAAVLRGADFKRHRPIVLAIEATLPTTQTPNWGEWEYLVTSMGYDFCLFDGLNRYYLRADRRDLTDRLSLPANLFDGYMTAREARLHERIHMLEADLAAARSAAGQGV